MGGLGGVEEEESGRRGRGGKGGGGPKDSGGRHYDTNTIDPYHTYHTLPT